MVGKDLRLGCGPWEATETFSVGEQHGQIYIVSKDLWLEWGKRVGGRPNVGLRDQLGVACSYPGER